MPITVSDAQRQKAKEKAIDFLNQNIVPMAMMLNIDTSTLTSSYAIPVPEGDPDYPAYSALLTMVTNLEALEA
jgi:hypothetical protein